MKRLIWSTSPVVRPSENSGPTGPAVQSDAAPQALTCDAHMRKS